MYNTDLYSEDFSYNIDVNYTDNNYYNCTNGING